jgi:hypothetical protein
LSFDHEHSRLQFESEANGEMHPWHGCELLRSDDPRTGVDETTHLHYHSDRLAWEVPRFFALPEGGVGGAEAAAENALHAAARRRAGAPPPSAHLLVCPCCQVRLMVSTQQPPVPPSEMERQRGRYSCPTVLTQEQAREHFVQCEARRDAHLAAATAAATAATSSNGAVQPDVSAAAAVMDGDKVAARPVVIVLPPAVQADFPARAADTGIFKFLPRVPDFCYGTIPLPQSSDSGVASDADADAAAAKESADGAAASSASLQRISSSSSAAGAPAPADSAAAAASSSTSSPGATAAVSAVPFVLSFSQALAQSFLLQHALALGDESAPHSSSRSGPSHSSSYYSYSSSWSSRSSSSPSTPSARQFRHAQAAECLEQLFRQGASVADLMAMYNTTQKTHPSPPQSPPPPPYSASSCSRAPYPLSVAHRKPTSNYKSAAPPAKPAFGALHSTLVPLSRHSDVAGGSSSVPSFALVDRLYRAQRPLVAPYLEPFLIRDLADIVLGYF